MKELSIEEKAKRYDKALDRAKKELDTCGSQDCDAARQIFRFFPELKESEDEKIRKEIISALKYANCKGVYDKHIAWLEKQGEQNLANSAKTCKDEQKPAWSEEDESMRVRTIGALSSCLLSEVPEEVTKEINWLKSLKERYTWKPSDEQMKCLDNVKGSDDHNGYVLNTLYNDLKKLRKE